MELSEDLVLRRRPARWAARAAAGMWRFARAKPLGAAGGVIVVLLALVAVFATVVAPYDPVETHYTHRVEAPSGAFPMGTDHFGRDVFSRVIHGARTSLFVAVVSVALEASLGGLVGLYSGFRGGRVDFVIQRLVDVVVAFPLLVLALAVMAGLGTSLRNV
ncbi:MAG: ABC transporter permease, partial [Chloroflexota bacterium]